MSPRDRTPEEREAARRDRERKRAEREGRPLPEFDDAPQAAPEPEPFDVFADIEPRNEARAPEPTAEPPAPEPPEHDHDPHATQAHDVTADWHDEPTPRPDDQERSADVDPDATQLHDVTSEWHDQPEAREPEPEPPTPDPEHDPHTTQLHDVTADWHDEADAAAAEPSAPSRNGATADHPAVDPDRPASDPRDPDPRPAIRAVADPDATKAHDATGDWGADWTDTGAHAATDPPSEDHERPLGTRRVGRAHLPNVHRPGRGGSASGGGGGRGRGRGRVGRGGRGTGRPRGAGGLGGGGRPRRSIVRRVFAGIAVLLAAAVVWFLVSLFQPFGGNGNGAIKVTIPRGATVSQIGDLLSQRGVVSSSFFFRARVTLAGDKEKLESGTYTLRKGMSYGSALTELTKVRPPVQTVNVLIPEGQSRRDAASLARQDGLRGSYIAATRSSRALNPRTYGAPRGATLEGFLFPATYQIVRHGAVQTLVNDQLAAFKTNWRGVDLSYARSRHLSAFDVLTIASMIEREAEVPRDRPLVAAVIYNRLRDNMFLGIDATLRFGLNDWTHPLTESQLQSNNPYNTRNHMGLPPGPIANPGLASIKAAAHPARVDYLYYVNKPNTCGELAFAANDAEFEADVARYNAARDANGGREPSKCP